MIALILGVFALTLGPLARATGDETTAQKTSVLLLLKILTYDKSFDARGAGDFVVMFASEPGQRNGRDALLDRVQSTAPRNIRGRPLKFVRLDLDGRDLDARLREAGASAVLVMPGVSAATSAALSKVGSQRRLYTLGLEAVAVEHGVALGVDTQDGKPLIMINRPASQAIGLVFEQSLLQRAKMTP